MRISDWSSDVCSADLAPAASRSGSPPGNANQTGRPRACGHRRTTLRIDRKSDVEGRSVSVRVDFGGRRIIKKKHDQLDLIEIYTVGYHSLTNDHPYKIDHNYKNTDLHHRIPL